jgi:hypothetical protein
MSMQYQRHNVIVLTMASEFVVFTLSVTTPRFQQDFSNECADVDRRQKCALCADALDDVAWFLVIPPRCEYVWIFLYL